MKASDRYYPCLACGRITARRVNFEGCPPAPFCSPECDPPPESATGAVVPVGAPETEVTPGLAPTPTQGELT